MEKNLGKNHKANKIGFKTDLKHQTNSAVHLWTKHEIYVYLPLFKKAAT